MINFDDQEVSKVKAILSSLNKNVEYKMHFLYFKSQLAFPRGQSFVIKFDIVCCNAELRILCLLVLVEIYLVDNSFAIMNIY